MAADPTTREYELETLWASRGVDRNAFVLDDDGTIVDRSDGEPHDASALPKLRTLGSGDTQPELALGDTIGQGAMGIVRRARQLALLRDVAVKTIRPDHRSAGAARDLIREARVTGAVAHPNVVPVHALGRDEDGEPMLVMKQVEGLSWRELLEQPEHPRHPDPSRKAIEFNLDILDQVCRAVSFAHSRGVLHRDLKPDNVMVGAFGEVYVVDWALGVALDDQQAAYLHPAADVEQVAGTPHYMAPEMAAGSGSELGPWSDVYQLGAILHEIVTGRTRHAGANTIETLVAAYESAPPALDDAIPSELAALIADSTHLDRRVRPQSADEFRRAVGQFRQHRQSHHLVEKAKERLAVLKETDVPQEARSAYAQCRFALGEALQTWPENEAARRLLAAVLIRMAELELSWGHVGAAEARLHELSEPPAELLDRVSSARSQMEKATQLSKDLDPTVGAKQRRLANLILGVLFSGIPLLVGIGHRSGRWLFDGWTFLGASVCFIVVGLVLEHRFRGVFRQTRFNQQVADVIRILGLAMLALTAAIGTDQISPEVALLMLMLVNCVVLAMAGATIQPCLAWSAWTFLAGFVIACFYLEYVHYVFSASVALSAVIVDRLWSSDIASEAA